MAFDPITHYQRNRDNVVRLRHVIGEAFYEEAVFAALGLVAGEKGATMEKYQGAQDFLKHLHSLTLDPAAPPAPMSPGIKHDLNYGRRKSSSSSNADTKRSSKA